MGEQIDLVETGSVKSALRALRILELLTNEARALSFAEFQEKLGYPKASLHGLLRTMAAARWLAFDPAAKRYALGVRIWEGGLAYDRMTPLQARALPLMRRVRDVTTETVQLAVLDDFDALYVAKVDGEHMLRLDSSVGLRLKAHATGVGKVLLAGLPGERLAAWIKDRVFERYTPNTITDASALLAELQAIRQAGHAIDREERTLGATCVAVGIRDHLGVCVAAMSVSAPAVRFGEGQRASALAHLSDAAEQLSASLGYGAAMSEAAGGGGRAGD
jgi:DNA-binding IclR family transcriptional regulator